MLDGDGFGESVTTLAQQAQLTERYTLRALDFIERSREKPFFLYLAHSMPHVPLGTPLRMAGVSEQGAYGDVISEIDASTGRIMAALEEHGLTDDTLVVFTSDNGPWQRYDNAGSAGELREVMSTGGRHARSVHRALAPPHTRRHGGDGRSPPWTCCPRWRLCSPGARAEMTA